MGNNELTKPKDIECKSELKPFERNRYFYGKLLTVHDFEAEQRYFIEKQRLINHLIHGSGVVCGLKVLKKDEERNGEPKLKDTEIRITEGVALDCCGREIVVPKYYDKDLSDETIIFEDGETKVYVLLKYDWCGKEMVPNVSDVSSCEETCCYSRIMESYKIEIGKEMPEECMPPDEGICEVWPNPSRIAAKTGPVRFERIMPSLIKKGEVFKVTLKVKPTDDLSSFKIEETLPSDFELHKGSLKLERKDVKKGETIYHTYWVRPKEVKGRFDIAGSLDWKKLPAGPIEMKPLPRSPIETTEMPEEVKAKRFVEYWTRGCPGYPEDPAVVLAAVSLKKKDGSFEITAIDNAIVDDEVFKKKLVFSNPRLYELIKCVEKQEGPQGPAGPPGPKGDPGPGLEEGLTYIKSTSWEHDSQMNIGNFFGMIDEKKFFIEFSNEIERGVDQNSFILTLRTPIVHPLEGVRGWGLYHDEYLPGRIIAESNRKRFIFTLDEKNSLYLKQYLKGLPYSRIGVLIKCDFIIDKKGKAVAGHHIGGRGSSGIDIQGKYNIQGGLFESWFILTTDPNIAAVTGLIRVNPSITAVEIAERSNLSGEAVSKIVENLEKDYVIYKKAGKLYPLSDPKRTMVVYDGKYNYLKESAEKLKGDLAEKGIPVKIKKADKITDEDKKNYEIILIRGGDVEETTETKFREVESKIKWSESTGKAEITKNPYIKDSNVFIIGGKNKEAVNETVNRYIKNYRIP